MHSTFARHASTPAELKEQLDADGRGRPYLLLRDPRGGQRIHALEDPSITVGRQAGNDFSLEWDRKVSRIHARLERLGPHWTVVDDGLSRNGTFLNGARVVGRRRLNDRDVLRFGRTDVLFRDPGEAPEETAPADDAAGLARLTDSQRRVLLALCRPLGVPGGFGTPASNREIAQEVHLSVDGVRTCLRALFDAFEVPDLPQNRKRAELARRALAAAVVTPADLTG